MDATAGSPLARSAPARVDGCAPLFDAPLGSSDAERLAEALRVLAVPARLRILSLIAAQPNGEVCQARFTAPLGLGQPTVSHHLKVLHDAGFVHRDKRGSWAYYRLAPQRLTDLIELLRPNDAHRPGPEHQR